MNLYAFYADESYYYLVMEMLRGGELLSVIADQDKIVSTFSEEDARRILYQICLGIQCVPEPSVRHAGDCGCGADMPCPWCGCARRCLHGHGVAHRDLKVCWPRRPGVCLAAYDACAHVDAGAIPCLQLQNVLLTSKDPKSPVKVCG